MPKIFKIMVFGLRGKKMVICKVCNKEQRMTVLQLKEKIAERLSKYADTTQEIITKKKLFGDYTVLSEYGIQYMSIIQMLKRLEGIGWPGGGTGETGNDGMGDKRGNNRSMERLADF